MVDIVILLLVWWEDGEVVLGVAEVLVWWIVLRGLFKVDWRLRFCRNRDLN
jgi:hypothetical protein